MGASNTPALYHGGVPGLLAGDLLLPPIVTGARSCADYDPEHCRPDRVYLTTDREDAAVYAALGGGGDVYEVEPLSELEPDRPDLDTTTSSYTTRAATVVTIVRRAVPVAEALARMRMAVAVLETAPGATRMGPRRRDATHGDEVTFLALARHTK
jgi:hypothetical protein